MTVEEQTEFRSLSRCSEVMQCITTPRFKTKWNPVGLGKFGVRYRWFSELTSLPSALCDTRQVYLASVIMRLDFSV